MTETFSLMSTPKGPPDRVEYFRGGYREFRNGWEHVHFYKQHDPGPYVKVERGEWTKLSERTWCWPHTLTFDSSLNYLFDMRD